MMQDNERRYTLAEGLVVVLAALIGFAVVAGLAFGVYCAIAYVAVYTATGFGHEIPYWPTVGLVFLVHMTLGILRR